MKVTLALILLTKVLELLCHPVKEQLEWLQTAGFASQDYDPKSMSVLEAEKAADEAIKAMKKFYNINNYDEAKSIISRPRCAIPDTHSARSIRRRFARWTRLGTSEAYWKKMPVTIGFKDYLPNLTKEQQEDVAMGCAKKWGEVSGLSFKLIRDEITNIYIQYTNLGGGSRVAVGLSPVPWGKPPSSFVQLDTMRTWKPRQSTFGPGLSLEEGICHEMGHTLGLGHSTDAEAIMYPVIDGRRRDTILSNDDILGIQSIYGVYKNQVVIVEDLSTTSSTLQPTTEQQTTTKTTSTTTTTTTERMTSTTPQPTTVRSTTITTPTPTTSTTEKVTTTSPPTTERSTTKAAPTLTTSTTERATTTAPQQRGPLPHHSKKAFCNPYLNTDKYEQCIRYLRFFF